MSFRPRSRAVDSVECVGRCVLLGARSARCSRTAICHQTRTAQYPARPPLRQVITLNWVWRALPDPPGTCHCSCACLDGDGSPEFKGKCAEPPRPMSGDHFFGRKGMVRNSLLLGVNLDFILIKSLFLYSNIQMGDPRIVRYKNGNKLDNRKRNLTTSGKGAILNTALRRSRERKQDERSAANHHNIRELLSAWRLPESA